MRVKLLQKTTIAEGTLYTEFGTESGEMAFTPGQFFRLTLLNPAYTDDRGNSRFLGFVNTPAQKGMAATVTRMGPSAFKRTLGDLSVGAEAEIDGIDGKMALPEKADIPVIIITGGIGITPMMSLLRNAREKSLNNKITLIYSNTNQSRAIFLDELTKYAEGNKNFTFVATMTQDEGWTGERRRIDDQFLKDYLELNVKNKYLITGTPRFVPAMVKHLRDTGVDMSQMKFEIFTGY